VTRRALGSSSERRTPHAFERRRSVRSVTCSACARHAGGARSRACLPAKGKRHERPISHIWARWAAELIRTKKLSRSNSWDREIADSPLEGTGFEPRSHFSKVLSGGHPDAVMKPKPLRSDQDADDARSALLQLFRSSGLGVRICFAPAASLSQQ